MNHISNKIFNKSIQCFFAIILILKIVFLNFYSFYSLFSILFGCLCIHNKMCKNYQITFHCFNEHQFGLIPLSKKFLQCFNIMFNILTYIFKPYIKRNEHRIFLCLSFSCDHAKYPYSLQYFVLILTYFQSVACDQQTNLCFMVQLYINIISTCFPSQ